VLSKADLGDDPAGRALGVRAALGGSIPVLAVSVVDAERCRFRDCSHRGEPGCAVAAAIVDGRLAADRLAGLEKLAREEAWIESRRDERARSERKRSAKRLQRELRRTYEARGRR